MTQLPNDAYSRTVTLSSDGTTDTYTVGGSIVLSFPTGTPQSDVYAVINSMSPPTSSMALQSAIAANLAQFATLLQQFITSRYSVEARLNLHGIYMNAALNNLTNRQAYVAQLMAWQNAVINYSGEYIATVEAMTSPAEVGATTPSFTALQTSDPLVTAIAALQIPN